MINLDFFKYFYIILIVISALLIFVFALCSKKPLKTLILSSAIGLVLIILINLTSKYTNVHIPINWYTCTGGVMFGIPAIIGFLILNLIFI